MNTKTEPRKFELRSCRVYLSQGDTKNNKSFFCPERLISLTSTALSLCSKLKCHVLLTSLILTFGITSCNSSEEKKNEVSIDGGAVGFPIHQAVAEEFQKVKPNSHNQNILVKGVAGDSNALGYVGISYYIQNQDKLNLVAVQSPKGKCEKPVPLENVSKNIYTPLSRPLFIYVSKQTLDSSAAVREFVDFYLTNSWKWVDQTGYIPLPNEAYVKIKQKLASGETGSKFKDAKPGQPIVKLL